MGWAWAAGLGARIRRSKRSGSGRAVVHSKHPKKEVNEALDYVDTLGHTVEQTAAGHKWGRVTVSIRKSCA
jgi:hypothetical protein